MAKTAKSTPYLSIVVASRNDDHGESLLKRMNIFLEALAEQVKRYKIPTELVMVELNPPADRPRLKEALQWPKEEKGWTTRIITVPHEVHKQLSGNGPLDFYQMIAKNVGIRRAKGEFILVTNVDIVFSKLLMEELSKKTLLEDTLYRCDRIDVENSPPENVPLDEMLSYFQKHVLRVNNKHGTWKTGADPEPQEYSLSPFRKWYEKKSKRFKTLFYATFDKQCRKAEYLGLWDDFSGQFRKIPHLHTNACGDFTLMHRNAWDKVGGYPELIMYSFYIDSLLLHMAYASGIKMIEFPPEMVIYHLEHGSGWTPENAHALFEFQRKKGSLTLKNGTYIKWAEKINRGKLKDLVGEDWGLRSSPLEEQSF